MIIQTDQKEYEVTETEKKWIAKRTQGKVVIKYEVPKEECTTFDDLKKRIIEGTLI